MDTPKLYALYSSNWNVYSLPPSIFSVVPCLHHASCTGTLEPTPQHPLDKFEPQDLTHHTKDSIPCTRNLKPIHAIHPRRGVSIYSELKLAPSAASGGMRPTTGGLTLQRSAASVPMHQLNPEGVHRLVQVISPSLWYLTDLIIEWSILRRIRYYRGVITFQEEI